tara:strand:- start:3626 stop:5500 length:1875 start_codon:yes stop_codon:yes gene_type:complete
MGFLSSLFGFGSSKAQPATSTVVQSQKLPPEIAPFVKEIAQEAQDLFKQRVGEGYVPFTGETIAQFAPQEEAAMAGIEGLVGTSRPLQEEALGVTRGLAEKFTPEKAQEYMSPYQKAVTDIEQREAQTRFEREIRPRFEASAVQAGGMSGLGTRAGVEAAELQRGQSQLLADIETRGLQSAFQDAQNQFAQQKQREAGMASELGRAGPAMFASGLQEAGALQTVGEQRRGREQSTLDEAFFESEQARRQPEQTLSEYSGFIYGNPLSQMPTQTQTGTSTPYQPSLGQSLLSIGSTLGAARLGRRAGGGYIGRLAGGGFIDRDRGLSGLPMFRRQAGTQVVSDEELEMIDQEGGSETIDEQVQVDSISGMDVQPEAERIIKLLGQGKITLPGEETREAGEKRLAGEKQSRVDLFNKFFPQEGEYAFAADALKGFGAMIVAEGNKPEKFREVFEKAREKGADKRQARHLANYKIGLESLGKKELFEKYTKDRPARIQKMLLAAQDRKLKTELMKAQTRDIDPRYKLRKDIEKLPLGLGNKEGEGFILNVSAILKAQNPEKYEAKNPGAGDVIEDLTNDSTRLVAIRAATLMKENPGTTLNDATLIAFDQLYKTGQLKEDQLLGFLW